MQHEKISRLKKLTPLTVIGSIKLEPPIRVVHSLRDIKKLTLLK